VELVGARVVLRPLTNDDLDPLVAMFAEPAVEPWWPRYDRARVEADLLHHQDDDKVVYAIVVDGEVAGVIQSWEEADEDYRHAGMDLAVGTRWHGTGVAVDALRTLMRHLVHSVGHHRLVIDPALSNERAIACYRKVGFRPVGVMRRYERGLDGSFHDSLLMDVLAEEMA
jgi:aminoglycoside 6'-N-acetyltransferase